MKFLKELLDPFSLIFFLIMMPVLLWVIKINSPEIPNRFLILLIFPMIILYAFTVERRLNNLGKRKKISPTLFILNSPIKVVIFIGTSVVIFSGLLLRYLNFFAK